MVFFWPGDVAQVIEHFPNKCEALSSNPVLPRKKKKEETNNTFNIP
jgi:hypothetical protein